MLQFITLTQSLTHPPKKSPFHPPFPAPNPSIQHNPSPSSTTTFSTLTAAAAAATCTAPTSIYHHSELFNFPGMITNLKHYPQLPHCSHHVPHCLVSLPCTTLAQYLTHRNAHSHVIIPRVRSPPTRLNITLLLRDGSITNKTNNFS